MTQKSFNLTMGILFAGVIATLILLATWNDMAGTTKAEAKQERVPQPTIVTEEHYITEVKDGFVRGEKTWGGGEGIYYTEEQLEAAGELKKGDIIQISWSYDAYTNELWDNIYSVERVE